MMMSAIHRLSCRGTLTVVAADGFYDVRFRAPGPYQGRAWCTSDEADFWSHCHLGAKDWGGGGADLDALIVECEEATRPRRRDIDELAFAIEWRRDHRTYGPGLPSWIRWHGWHPCSGPRWLGVSAHEHEYLDGYLRSVEAAREHEVEMDEARLREARALSFTRQAPT